MNFDNEKSEKSAKNHNFQDSMASVIKQKWGSIPSFLNIKKPRTLFQAIGHFKSFEGVKVTTRDWFNKGLDQNYYMVTRLEMNPVY